MIQGAIFDMDGTLLDSMGMWRSVGSYFLRRRGFNPPEDYDTRFRHLGWVKGLEKMKSDYNLPGTVSEIQAEMNKDIVYFYDHDVELKQGTEDMLRGLQALGVRLAVATATPLPAAMTGLAHTGILHYFDIVCSTSENGKNKQDGPDVYLRALAAIGTPLEKTAVFEDALFAAKVAAGAGFSLAAVADPSESAQDELRTLARWYLPSPAHWRLVTEDTGL